MPDCSENLSVVIDNHVPSLEELKMVFQTSLLSNFENVEVNIVDCPDLSKPPFNQKSSGFGHNLRIAEVGGPGNLYPGFHIDHQFDIPKIGKVCEHPEAAVFGPGAGPWPIVGQNCEMVADVNLKTGEVGTRIAEINSNSDKRYVQRIIDEPKFSLMANLALSDADKSSTVVHFKASVRKGEKNLTNCIRDGLQEHFGKKIVSLAGQFIIQTGKARLHVMPDFPGCPFENNAEVDKWLNYFEMSAPLICATVMHSYDPGHNLRLEHTHCYSDHGDAGHYHYDVTPETVSYEGWFAPASKIYRIDEIKNR
ncbi:DUF1907 domain-containing protein [Caenorhabditis elegans]|uniref:DUF1907 domain-containing protein n=1 Tax=Caenorhabditis elegans TaxID=6239 RepID=Q3Y402_CAEEL|nr:DUF1907 domain-containing protein [Caenorhabditis elegans]CCD61431.1 DUF1907 domain-containing protein [Caenorhabditis elegans]|eukprot:NP_505382.2 Uncharacterized protein CELE_C24B5.4 [Caenorhabditis elegans]